MWVYDPFRTCRICLDRDTCFNMPANYIFNVCYLCTREQRNIKNRQNYKKYKKSIIKRNKEWRAKNPQRFELLRRKSIVRSTHKENFYLTENI